ncbi:unnamed protein product [Closterium sp. NIES-54]
MANISHSLFAGFHFHCRQLCHETALVNAQGGSWNLCLGAEEMSQGSGDAAEKRNEPPPSKIEALDGSNYEEWSGRMRSAFKRYKLLKLAMGEEKMPEEGDARDRWIEKSAVLYDLILQSVNNDMFQHIKDLVELDDSGPKAWKLLRDVIQTNTLPMVIVLEKELAALSMRPGDDVKPVLDKIKDTYARMAAAGSNVSQMQQCTKIISVLDNSWDNLIPTLNTQQDQWTPEWLRQQILQEDFRRRHTGGGAANKTAEGYGAAGGSRGRGGGRGRGCGKGFGRGRGQGDYNEGHESSADVVTHLRTSDARYRATVPAEFLPTNQPPMFITLYFIVIRLPDSLRSVRDHFLTLDPTSITVDLLEQHLLAAETSAVAVGAARGTPCSPFFQGCSPSPLSSSFASAAAADASVPEDVGAASTSMKRRNSKGKGGRGSGGGSGGGGGGSGRGSGGSGRGGVGGGGGGGGGTGGRGGGSGGGGGGSRGSGGSGGGGTSAGRSGPQRGGLGGGRVQQQQRRSETQTPQQLREWLFQRGAGEGSETCPYVIRTGACAGRTCRRFHTARRCFARLDDALRTEFGDDVERPRWAELLRSGVAIFDLDFDVIISAMCALCFTAEGDCYWCVPPNPGIAVAALGASASGTPPGTAPAEALHTFTLDSCAARYFFRDSTTLTPLFAPVPVGLADPSEGLVVASSSTVLPCLAVPSGSLSGLHLPSFSTNLVSTAALQDAMVTTTTHGGQHVLICTCTRMGRNLATFTRRPELSLYTLATEPPQVAASSQVSASGQVAASCSCRLLSHQTLL